jgi:DNA-binding transcriptional MerR regulator
VEQDLISKKELLELTGISYGQLYRWKRKNLIPEEWFIRKSTFTGQETFFPRERILERIDKILNMKDDLSLDELADKLSPNPTEVALTLQQLIERNIVSKFALNLFLESQGENEQLVFEQIFNLYVLDKLLQTGEINLDEGKMLLQILHDHYPKFEGKACELVLVRKMGISSLLLVSSPGEIYFDSGTKMVIRLPLIPCIEELKLKLT